jgi:hypothetical protein
MAKLHDFLVEHAKFPFPPPDELRSVDTTDISPLEVAVLKEEWKARHAVRDDALVQKLCHTLKKILADTPLAANAEHLLLGMFSPNIEFDELGGRARVWSRNDSEARVSFRRSSFQADLFELTLGAE